LGRDSETISIAASLRNDEKRSAIYEYFAGLSAAAGASIRPGHHHRSTAPMATNANWGNAVSHGSSEPLGHMYCWQQREGIGFTFAQGKEI